MTFKLSKEDLQSFHRIDRHIFARLVFRLGRDISLVMRVMALWLWLEEVGYPSVILALRDMPDDMIIEFFHEAITILRVLQSEVQPFLPSSVAIPKTFNLMGQQVSLTLLHEQRAFALNGISHTISEVCALAFGDDVPNADTAIVPSFPVPDLLPEPPLPPFTGGKIHIPMLPSIPHAFHPAWHPVAPFRGFLPIVFQPLPYVPPPPPPFMHNVPWALTPQHYEMGESSHPFQEQRPAIEPPPQEMTGLLRQQPQFEVGESSNAQVQIVPTEPTQERTMFVTFSRGFPVSELELSTYLARTYGDVVEAIYLAETLPGVQPLWARVVFRSSSTVEQILKGEEKVRFVIKGKHVWTRRWVQN
ncbi:hypothetical protein ACHQM5_025990 [Ranunculus cassubicifolius]